MFHITILTPSKKIIEDVPVKEVFIPGRNGEMHILPGHSPLMATMTTGVLRYTLEDSQKEDRAAISWGYAHVTAQGVNILAETAEVPEEIDVERTHAAEKKAEQALTDDSLDTDGIEKNLAKIDRARIRREVAEGRKDH